MTVQRTPAIEALYVPPPPEWVPGLMDDLLAFANDAPKRIDPLVCAAVVSFAFVFIHPNLVLACLQNNGKVSANRRKKFADTVPELVFDAIEAEWQSLLRS